MTEDEAKMKWCPFIRAGSGTFPYTLCIASACMAWRLDRSIKSGDGFIRHGYCGLAGKPHVEA